MRTRIVRTYSLPSHSPPPGASGVVEKKNEVISLANSSRSERQMKPFPSNACPAFLVFGSDHCEMSHAMTRALNVPPRSWAKSDVAGGPGSWMRSRSQSSRAMAFT